MKTKVLFTLLLNASVINHCFEQTTEMQNKLNRLILTATMGSKARLRTMYPANGTTKEAGQL